ncbi:MAG: hypothetical protein AABX48_03425 [Nanoarchaeota archaeon]
MKRRQLKQISDEELEILESQLGPDELFIVGYLKGFNRQVTRDWAERDLWE